MSVNPWQAEGVSILPSDLKDLMPIVGQQDLFQSLTDFRSETLSKGKDALSGFFVIMGGWGVGKSRVGHELCLEAAAPEAQWILTGNPHRVLQAGLSEGILPIFVRYSQVTSGPLGSSLSTDTWIPTVAWEALCRLTGIRGDGEANRLTKNQVRLIELTRNALGPKGRGWASALPQLKNALAATPVDVAVKQALDILRDELQVQNIWIVVDEIEDITDIERDGLRSEDRGAGVDQALMTVIPRVIKYEEVRGEFPQISFVLLCSMALGDLMKGIPSIGRRTRWHQLKTNAFQDVEAFFRYLQDHRPTVASSIAGYPAGLKEAVFFAANRNFGWFNVILHHAHNNHRQGTLAISDLLRKFAENPSRGLRGTVFDLEAISDYQIPHDGDFPDVERLIFGLLPKPVGVAVEEVRPDTAARLYAKTFASGKNLFTRVIEIEPPAPHLITAHLVKSGFRNPEGNILEMPGEVRFNIQEVMEGLKAYSIGLPKERRQKLLICEDKSEFTEQIRSLSPYASEAEQFAPSLHELLVTDRSGDLKQYEQTYIAPAFSFLRRFNRLNKLREAEAGYLRDGRKNSHLEEAYQRVAKDKTKLAQSLVRGIAYAWEKDPTGRDLTDVEFLDALGFVGAQFVSQQRPLNLGAQAKVSLAVIPAFDEAKLEDAFNLLAREARHPIVLVLENNPDLEAQLRMRTPRIAPDLAPFVVVLNLSQSQTEVLGHLGLMGSAFDSNELRTRYFSGWIDSSRQILQQQADAWRRSVESQGLILRPIFHGRSARHDDLHVLALGYNQMLTGASFDQVLNSATIPAADRDLFKKVVSRHLDPGPKYYEFETLGLFQEEAGVKSVHVPRPLLAFAQRCSGLPATRTALEEFFLYETPDDTKPRDIVQQITLFLTELGMLDVSGDKVALVTTKSLQDTLERADDWVKRDLEAAISEIEAIHHDVAVQLTDHYVKMARQQLKDAHKKLESLDLGFLKEKWDELNKTGSDGNPLYSTRWRTAVQLVSELRLTTANVFNSEANKGFVYTADLLPEYESQSQRDSYPLWRRVAILRGLYRDIRDRRHSLESRIGEIRKEAERRIPELNGERIFPLQALTLPLDFYTQEINFPAEKPNRTIQMVSTALGVQTVGFKLSALKYQEALQRIDAISAELNSPGRLISLFMDALKEWEGIRADVQLISSRVDATLQFFADADAATKVRFRLNDLEDQIDDLRGVSEEGLMRSKTDQRESSGVPIFDLTPKLAADVQEIKPRVSELRLLLDGIDNSVTVRLQEDYQEKHSPLLRAFQKVRIAQNLPAITLPERREVSWRATVKLFDDVICKASSEGEAYLSGGGQITFSDFVKLCEMEERLAKDNRDINWDVSPYKEYVPFLVAKRLLRLKLV